MKKKVLKYDSPFMTLGNFSKTSLDSGHYLFCIYKLHMHVHYSCIFMLCELSQATLFLYSELQLYIWSQPVAFFSPTLRLFSFPHPPFLSSFLPPFYLVICMCLWQKATQGRKTLAASLVLLELELWETMFSWVYNIKMMSKYKEMSESANLGNELWQLWIWVSKTRLFHYYLYQSAT